VNASLVALKDYTRRVFGPALPERELRSVTARFDAALAAVGRVGEPIDVAVATTQGRVRVEALQGSIRSLAGEVAEHVGPGIGVASGFNSMDGD
jgi:predicted lipoprotein